MSQMSELVELVSGDDRRSIGKVKLPCTWFDPTLSAGCQG